jgi:hypothetical protein
LDREGSDPCVIGEEEGLREHQERIGLRVGHRRESTVEGGGLARLEDPQLHPQRPGGRLYPWPYRVVGRQPLEHRHAGDARERLLQQLQMGQR